MKRADEVVKASRESILQRIREGLLQNGRPSTASSGAGVATPGGPGTPISKSRSTYEQTVDLFERMLRDYKAGVLRVEPEGLGAALAELVASTGVKSLVVPPGLDAGIYSDISDAVRILIDDRSLRADELATIEGVLTGCSCAIAETGTIVLSGMPDEGRRAITLLPDYHFCIVNAGFIIPSVSGLFERVDVSNPVTLISGPSATSDIELKRVEGVHGPRHLFALIVA